MGWGVSYYFSYPALLEPLLFMFEFSCLLRQVLGYLPAALLPSNNTLNPLEQIRGSWGIQNRKVTQVQNDGYRIDFGS
jgi:hypothetical protein